MPYIRPEDRFRFHKFLRSARKTQIKSAGELNYIVTILIGIYVEQHKLCYQTLNDVTGALMNAAHEMYRRLASPYEDQKIAENGDVNCSLYTIAKPASNVKQRPSNVISRLSIKNRR